MSWSIAAAGDATTVRRSVNAQAEQAASHAGQCEQQKATIRAHSQALMAQCEAIEVATGNYPRSVVAKSSGHIDTSGGVSSTCTFESFWTPAE